MKTPLIAKVMKNPDFLKDIENPSFDVCMAALVLDGMCIKYIDASLFTRREYHSMCEAAVRQNPRAFTKIKRERFSALKWEHLKSYAVRQNGLTLQWIKDQTPEICLEAVKNNPKALSFIDKSVCNSRCYSFLKKAAAQKTKEIEKTAEDRKSLKPKKRIIQHMDAIDLLKVKKQSEALCLEAVKLDGLQIRYVWKQTRKLCLAAHNQNPEAIDFIRDSSLILIDDLFSDMGKGFSGMASCIADLSFYYVNKKAKKKPINIKTEGRSIDFDKYYNECDEALDKNYCNLKFVNHQYLTYEQYKNLCIKAIKKAQKVLIFINNSNITNEWYYNICCEAVNKIKNYQIENFLRFIAKDRFTSDQYYQFIKNIVYTNLDELPFHLNIIDAKKLTNEQYFSICKKLIYKKYWYFNQIQPNFLKLNQYTELCSFVVKKETFNITHIDKKYLLKSDWLTFCKTAIKKKNYIFYYLDISSKKDFKELHQFALKNGCGLKYIEKQNYKQCISVLKKNGNELNYVNPNQFTNEQYFNLCKTAVENKGSISFVDDEVLEQEQYEELCEIALKSFNGNIRFINYEKIQAKYFKTWYYNAIEENPYWIYSVPYSKYYYSLCLKAVKKNGDVLKDINYLRLSKEEYAAVCKAAVKQNKEAEKYIVK